MTHTTAGAVGITCLVSIDILAAEQRAQLAAVSQEARPSEEYRIQFAALAQRRRDAIDISQRWTDRDGVSSAIELENNTMAMDDPAQVVELP